MLRLLLIFSVLWTQLASPATIAIIDTGFDLDHNFLKPKILKQETDEEAINPDLKEFSDWQFHDNSHLKEAVITDQSVLHEILLYRNLRAKGHGDGLSLSEFEWFKKKSSDEAFMAQVKNFKKHSHGTFVAGIALREGENINLFPIRGLHISTPVVAVEDSSGSREEKLKSRTPEEKFKEEIKNSKDRVLRKFSKICRYLHLNGIDIVNASYGITYKNITTKFRENYKKHTGKEIDEPRLKMEVDRYFKALMDRSIKVIKKYPRMLFVFSAGNSGINNDEYHHYPSKIKLPNTLAVGAMNGDFLASFSNYGQAHVDVGAPGVAILSLVPGVYSKDGKLMYSPSSGTSMAAPYISNLAAQVLNLNSKLKPAQVKRVILETGDVKEHLTSKLISGAIANNERALKAAMLSKEMDLDQAIGLARSGLIPMENTNSSPLTPPLNAQALQKKVMDAIPKDLSPGELDEIESTSGESSSVQAKETSKPGSLNPLPSKEKSLKKKSSDPGPSNQSEEQSPPLSAGTESSSSQDESQHLRIPNSESVPSSP